MVIIYAIKLESGKYYVGKTNNLHFRIEKHFNSNASKWTTLYKPIKILEIKPNCDDYDEDKMTIQYMNKYGINNVRGGSFVSVRLDKSTINTLEKMISGANNKCFICGKFGHFSKKCKENKRLETANEEEYEEEYEEECEAEYEVWSCSYCGKDFDSYKGAIFHENVHCKKKKTINYKNSKQYSTNNYEYYDFQTNKKSPECYRCGREGHYSSNCYASKHIKGYNIN